MKVIVKKDMFLSVLQMYANLWEKAKYQDIAFEIGTIDGEFYVGLRIIGTEAFLFRHRFSKGEGLKTIIEKDGVFVMNPNLIERLTKFVKENAKTTITLSANKEPDGSVSLYIDNKDWELSQNKKEDL